MEGANMETKASQAQLRRRRALLLAMHQPFGLGGRRLNESCVALLAASEGYLDDTVDGSNAAVAGTAEGQAVMDALLEFVAREAADAMSEIDTTLDTSPEVRKSLRDTIQRFFDDEKKI